MVELSERWLNRLAGSLTPRSWRARIATALTQSGVKMKPGTFTALAVLNALLLAVIVLVLVDPLLVMDRVVKAVIVLPFPFLAFVGMIFGFLSYLAGKRAVAIEENLPDSLQLISANLRAGIPIHKAVLLSSKPEFGLLGQQLKIIGNEITSGASVEEAFRDFRQRVKSPLVDRVTSLIVEGLAAGHDLASLMDEVAADIRVFRTVEAEAKANIGAYVLFIIIAIVLIAPALFAISISFVDMSQAVRAQLDLSALAEAGYLGTQAGISRLLVSEPFISREALIAFAAANLLVTTVIAALVVSVLQTGEEFRRLPYCLVFAVVGLAIFFLALAVIRSAFSVLLV